MPQWDSTQYLKFKNQRTRPAVDLAEHVPLTSPQKVLDVGCGPGNSTAVLAKRFPGASVTGIDNSPNMIEAAKKAHPDLNFVLADVNADLSALGKFDLVFSNACIQWVPNHDTLIPRLLNSALPGGYLAIQVPMNQDTPIQRLIRQTAMSPEWCDHFSGPRIFFTLTPPEYYDILVKNSRICDLWMTTYYHILPGAEAILEWYRGTGLRPYLEALSEMERPKFERCILEKIRENYPAREDGTVIFPFPRFFMLAQK
ncbi:MAG TPA: methyltransferase domain-containing protein [Oscillospiraceae bacterium]|nr:methyltransferase domain-containing protein [Oscillospiraceae bacterium]HPF55308.1 methyltransferase domain-containing protein [Clostridiales bacterium]HPK34711.1 methyltransferase domain-containing protein [Oscillospiraceae bacterium]HPR74525.1 methyltransferase domain-containing protein [Oscillospiraceae bacterium]